MRLIAKLMLVAALLVASSPARADSWAEPTVSTTVSENGQYRLVVTPRAIDGTLEYFRDRVRNVEPAGQQAGGPRTASARLERREADGSWSVMWDRPLINDVAPASVLVANDGRHTVTFDNWYSVGFGVNVVVIYDDKGELVRSMALNDIIPEYFVHGFARSVSSMSWQHEATRLDGDVLQLAILEPGGDLSSHQQRYYVIPVNLTTGEPQPLEADVLARLRPSACSLHRAYVEGHNASIQRLRADLIAPTGRDRREWDQYFVQAAQRLFVEDMNTSDPMVAFENEPFLLLEPGEYMYEDFRDGFRDALQATSGIGQRSVFAAMYQDRMVAEIERAARSIRAGSLSERSMYFFADNEYWPRIQAALSASGAQLHQIDPQRPIPQRTDILAELGPDLSIDSACVGPVVAE